MLLDLGHNHKICIIGKIQRNLGLFALCKKILERKEAVVSQNGAIVVYTGRYTGRAPTDRFIVDTPTIHNDINWGKLNIALSEDNFYKIYQRVIEYLSKRISKSVSENFRKFKNVPAYICSAGPKVN